jgi:hypothetical protein
MGRDGRVYRPAVWHGKLEALVEPSGEPSVRNGRWDSTNCREPSWPVMVEDLVPHRRPTTTTGASARLPRRIHNEILCGQQKRLVSVEHVNHPIHIQS